MLFTDKAWILFEIMSSIAKRIRDYTIDIRVEGSRNLLSEDIQWVDRVCWQMSYYVFNRVYTFFHRWASGVYLDFLNIRIMRAGAD